MDEREIRLRCIEAAAKAPNHHVNGFSAGVMESADRWFKWIITGGVPVQGVAKTLTLPVKDGKK
jgi:hypothetical protein